MKQTLLFLLASAMLSACGDSGQRDEHAEAEEHGAAVPAHVATATVENAGSARIRDIVQAYGTVALNAERTRHVSARFAGVVTAVAKAPGDPVRAGDTLASIESNESLQVYAVRAPIAGVVMDRTVNAGETVEQQSLFTVSDLSSLWAELLVFPGDVARLRTGQPVSMRSADGALKATATISHIAPAGDRDTQAIVVRVPIDNRAGQWRPGVGISADIAVAEIEVPVSVRSTALQTVDGERVVFVVTEAGYEPRPVVTGRADEEHTEIASGLAAGERYVATDSFVVKAELEKSEAGHEH
ncbi:MAG TPA: efflux RND transporter periplasmic adaptor subunit [Steroidobacteraceae bacterium]|nr:efflux RND transporter periplasmic adaptor subunit [Steroidobacteraceae bacterium]